MSEFTEFTELSDEIGDLLIARMEEIRIAPPKNILNLGAESFEETIRKQWPTARIVSMTISSLLNQQDAENLKNLCFDLILSNMALHLTPNLSEAFRAVRHVLKPDRPFLFTMAGPPVTRIHVVGDFLHASGLMFPVIDRETITETVEVLFGHGWKKVTSHNP